MGGIVRLRLGDLFDGPSDLVVFPCSTIGTVTGFVARSLAHYALPHPRDRMKHGEVEIMPFEGGENIAQFVAFAASVANVLAPGSSTSDAIRSIGRTLGQFTTQQPSARVIAAPLLGAGAGGLQSEKVVAALRDGFLSTADSGASLVVHVLHQDVFDRLRGNRTNLKGSPSPPLRVFISHTSDTPDQQEWVKQLALYLIDRGIQARLDKFHLRRGMDLSQWMCNEISLAQKVIIVCDENYKQKAEGRLGGVGWETMIIQGDIANLPPDSTKYQIIVRAEDMKSGLPLYLKTKFAFHAKLSDTSDSFREELVKELLDYHWTNDWKQRNSPYSTARHPTSACSGPFNSAASRRWLPGR